MAGDWLKFGRSVLAYALLGAAAVAPVQGAPALKVTLQLEHVGVPEAAAQLARDLGAPVRVEGTRKAPLSVDVTEVSGREALEAVAGAANGRWQRVYVFSGHGKGGGAGRLSSGRLVTLSIEDTNAATAAAMIAKAAGARWELEDVPDKPVSISVQSEPVEGALDQLATAAGVQWRAEYVLTVAEPAPKVVSPAAGAIMGARRGGPLPSGSTGRTGLVAGRGGGRARPGASAPGESPRADRGAATGPPMLRQGPPADSALCRPEFYSYIFQLPRTKREPFVAQLAEELKSSGQQPPSAADGTSIGALLRFERNQRLKTIVTLIRSLTPAQQKELKPIMDAIPQGVQTGTISGAVGVGQPP